MSDKEQFQEWLLFFDRPAWRGPFSWQTDPRPYEKVLTDTLKAINTGQLVTRGGTVLSDHSARGKSQLREPQLRVEMDDIVQRLERLRKLVREIISAPVTAMQEARERAGSSIDADRDEIVRRLNTIAARFNLHTLPLPTSVRY